MTFRLVYTARAVRDLNNAADYIARHAPKASKRWFNDFTHKTSRLCKNALTHGLAPESESVGSEIRQVIFRTKSRRKNRVLFTVRDNTVYILCIRRPGQDILSADDTKDLIFEIDNE